MERIKTEIPEPRDGTAMDVKKATRKLKLANYMENFYYLLFTDSGREPPYIRREVEHKMVRLLKQIDRIYGTIGNDRGARAS